jgi:hypothetical protein
MHEGKVIGRGVVVDSGIWAIHNDKHNESIEFGKELASVCFNSRDKIHKHIFLLGIVAMPIDRPTEHAGFLLMRTTNWPNTLVKIVEM